MGNGQLPFITTAKMTKSKSTPPMQNQEKEKACSGLKSGTSSRILVVSSSGCGSIVKSGPVCKLVAPGPGLGSGVGRSADCWGITGGTKTDFSFSISSVKPLHFPCHVSWHDCAAGNLLTTASGKNGTPPAGQVQRHSSGFFTTWFSHP